MSPAAAGSRAAVRLAEARKTLPPGAIDLACHAAVPVVIDPTFLNLLRINFFMDPPADLAWTVEAALLTSPLFRELGGELFEIDEELRRSLLVSLRTRYGSERIEQVALLLERYCDQPGVWGGQPHLARAQRLTVVGILDPAAAVGWLDDLRTDDATQVELSADWVVAMRGRLTAMPAADVSLDDEIAAAAERLRAGDPAARADLNTLEMLPGSDVDAVRAALRTAPEGDEARRLWSWDFPDLPRVDFDPSFHRVDLTWGRRKDGKLDPLPLAGAVLHSHVDNNSDISLGIRLRNLGDDVYVSVLEIDAALRVTAIGDYFVPEGGSSEYAWRHAIDQLDVAQTHRSLSTHHANPSPARITVVFADAPVQLGSLDGHILTRDASELNDWLSGIAMQQATTNFPEHAQPLRFAVTEINYSIVTTPIVEVLTDAPEESNNRPSLESFEETVADLRLLTTIGRESKLSLLAQALNALSVAQAAYGRFAEAVPTVEETVHLFRELAEENPDVHLPGLISALGRLSRALATTGRFEQAFPPAQEAVYLSRQSGNLTGLASALDWMAELLAATGQSSDAAGARREADAVRRRLAAGGWRTSPADSREDPVEAGRRAETLTASEDRGGPDREAGDAAGDPSRDAVVFVPGLGASELVEAAGGRMLWGTTVSGLIRVATGQVRSLLVTDAERVGNTGRIAAPRLMGNSAVLPGLFNLDPHGKLIADMRSTAAHSDAVLEFPYDWRLSTTHNARMLAAAAERHLAKWRTHPAGSPEAKLTLVAHSLGGLVALHFLISPEGAATVRRFLAIGTPFYGTVKAVASVNRSNGFRGVRGLRALYRSMPAMYDMMPSYRCVDSGGYLRHLTVADVAAIGGDEELAAEAVQRRIDPETIFDDHPALQSMITTVVGRDQPTPQTLRIADGTVTTQNFLNLSGERIDRTGDGTVYRDAARLPGASVIEVSERTATLASSQNVRATVRAFLTARPLGPPM